MELVYAYVDRFSNFIFKQGFRFSQKFHVEYDDSKSKLFIKEKEHIKNFFGEKIKGISIIIGQNGSGKTTLLDLLGMKMEDRRRSYEKYKDKYFILYHIKENLFGIEGYGLDLIKELVNNLPLNNNFPITDPYSIVVEKIKMENRYNYLGFMQLEWDDKKQINEKIIYVNIRDKYNDRYSRDSLIQKDDYTVFGNRFYGNEIGYKEKYKLICSLAENQKKLNYKEITKEFEFFNTSVEIIIEKEFLYYSKDDEHLKINLTKKECRKGFIIASDLLRDISPKRKDRNYTIEKQNYVLDFLVKYIHESFNQGIIERIKYQNDDAEENIDKEVIQMQNEIDILYSKIYDVTSYDKQVIYLLKIIKMISDKIESYVRLRISNKYYESIVDYIQCIMKINEKYFKDEFIKIPIKPNEEDDITTITKLLEVFDKYRSQNTNNLSNNIKINFNNLSDGENEFLEIFARINESLKNPIVRYGDTIVLVLDEPDRSFHPEWSRKFIPILIDNINTLENVDSKYQIIISTHSPFMTSDVSNNEIILLRGNGNGKNQCGIKERKEIGKTFAGNIHTILSKEFFLNATIGEFSKKKINESIKFMIKYRKYLKDILLEFPEEFNEIKLKEKKEEIEYIIDIIGEPIIKRKLEELYKATFPEEERDYRLEIRKLEEEKAQLEKILDDKGLNTIESVFKLLEEKINKLKLEFGDEV